MPHGSTLDEFRWCGMRVGQSRRRDSNEADIVKALRKLGVIVKHISAEGIPDLLCFHPYTGLFLLEVKTGKGTLTRAQQRTEGEMPFRIARTEDDAVMAFLDGIQRFK